jgi:hypothetical protein
MGEPWGAGRFDPFALPRHTADANSRAKIFPEPLLRRAGQAKAPERRGVRPPLEVQNDITLLLPSAFVLFSNIIGDTSRSLAATKWSGERCQQSWKSRRRSRICSVNISTWRPAPVFLSGHIGVPRAACATTQAAALGIARGVRKGPAIPLTATRAAWRNTDF